MEELIERLESAAERLEAAPVGNSPAAFQVAASSLTRKVGEAYTAAVSLKLMYDKWHELPPEHKKIYKRTMSVIDQMGRAKDDAYQSQMELKRILQRG